jgi:hypothetical protein
MALHEKKDWAKLAGMPVSTPAEVKRSCSTIATYITRGKLIASGKYIDDQLPENRDWLLKRIGSAAPIIDKTTAINYEDEIKKTVSEKIDRQLPEKNNRKEPKVKDPNRSATNGFLLDLELKQKDIEKRTEEVEILKIKKDKMRGQYIEYDIVLSLMVNHSESIKSVWEASFDDFITKFAAMNSLTREQLTELKREFIKTANTATERFVSNSKKVLRKISNQLSEEKGVGES